MRPEAAKLMGYSVARSCQTLLPRQGCLQTPEPSKEPPSRVVFSFLAFTLLAPWTRINTGSSKKFLFHLLGAQIWAKRGFLHVVSLLVIPHFRQPDLLLMIGG